MPENAILNMEEIGYVSVIASPEILEWANNADENKEAVDLSYFFGEDATAVHANQVFYPDRSLIERCALMHDCGDQTKDMLEMWNRVKGDNLSSGIVVFLVVVLLLIVGGITWTTINKRKKKAQQRKKRR